MGDRKGVNCFLYFLRFFYPDKWSLADLEETAHHRNWLLTLVIARSQK